MAMQTFSVFLYTENEFRNLTFGVDDNCEAICRELCKDLGITPIVCTLFSLRIKGDSNFLPNCRPVLPNVKYEFRVRYQIPSLSSFKKLDKIAYNYYFHQVKSDLINNLIPELEYPNHKEKVVGLAVTSMYIEMLERDISIDELEKNYRNYVPQKHIKKHMFIIKQKISKELRHIRNMNHDSYYVKGTYLETINTLAPNHLVERYNGIVPYLPEDELQKGTCPVDLEFSPFHLEHPGLNVYYSYKKCWRNIARVDDVYAVIIEKDVVKLEIRDNPAGFSIRITDPLKLESFVSCITGYYRLMVKWTVDLCRDLPSPSLESLRSLKCHGPIGGEYAYVKLEEKQCIPGSYIIRQCEKSYDNYFIDIITKSGQADSSRPIIETFKITQHFNMWQLHLQEGSISFSSLTELAKSIPTESKQKFRLAPSDYDKSPLLLLCLPPQQLTAKKSINEHSEFQMRQKRAQLLHPVKDFRKYINSQKVIENGIITQMRADWILPDDKKLEVTLKILNMEKHLSEFMRLAEKWSGLYSPELIKMYGFTLSAPHTLVIESTRLGPLDEFLRNHNKHAISMVALIEAAYSLARALHYLQENNIIHGRIRCSTLQVIRFEGPNMLLVRLGDPGFQKSYSKNDLPWIPFEYHNNLEHAKLDFKAEVWAYATTMWEIFSRGKTPTLREFLAAKRRLLKPADCSKDLYSIMLEGWDPVPDKRFSPQMIFAKLICAREAHSHSYSSLYTGCVVDTSTIRSNDSLRSTTTEDTHLISQIDTNSESSERVSTHSDDASTISDNSSNLWTNDEQSPLIDSTSSRTILSNNFEPLPHEKNDFDYSTSIIDLDNGAQVIYQGKIGNGHYGSVYRGQYEYDSEITEVAIKRLKATPDKNILKDFEREIKIMQNLQHPNIVKIITWTDTPHILIIMEFVRHRSFLMYLSSKSPSLTTQRLLHFAKDIASGMEYLVSKKIVHRDLAARNILVDSDECVKISDFGLAQMADANGYYVVRNTRDIPIKWYAPETLRSNKYSYYSDVWSYGVTLFEMFSRGQEPNLVPGRDLSPIELLECLEKGDRLGRPSLCPQIIYVELLMACWHDNPKRRPDFTQLLVIINRFISEFGETV